MLNALWLGFAMTVGQCCHGASPLTYISKPEVKVGLTEMEQIWLKAHPEVRWGADPNWAPFSSFDRNQKLVGIDADITTLIAGRVGLRLTVTQTTSWAEAYAKAKAGDVDFLSATAKSPERLADFDYTEQYGTFPVVIVTRNGTPFVTTIPDLRSLIVAAPREHVTTLKLQQEVAAARFILTDSAEEALKLVAHGKADATVENLAVASRVIRSKGFTNLKISGVTRYEFPLCFAVRKDAPELTAILNKELATITGKELETICAAHLTPDIAPSRDWTLWRRRALYTAMIGGGVAGFLLFWNYFLAQQIRFRKAAQKALLAARNRLQRRTEDLDLRIEEVQKLNTELQAINQDLESFSRSISHDLRGPLRRICSFAELLQNETSDFLSQRHREWISLLVKESRRTGVVMQDLLEFTRLGRGKLRKQPVNMAQLVKTTIEDFRPQLHDRDVVWNIEELCEVEGDARLLHCAVANLIDNALKYTRRCPQAQIKIGNLSARSQIPQAILYVQDNGCGFDMKEAKRIFDPFQSLQNEKEYDGIGIGLANVRKIIEKHGGRIWFKSARNQGATFYFSLTRSSGKDFIETKIGSSQRASGVNRVERPPGPLLPWQ